MATKKDISPKDADRFEIGAPGKVKKQAKEQRAAIDEMCGKKPKGEKIQKEEE